MWFNCKKRIGFFSCWIGANDDECRRRKAISSSYICIFFFIPHSLETLNWKEKSFVCERWERAERLYTYWEDRLRAVSAVADRSTRMYIYNLYRWIYSTNTTQCFACLSFNNIFVFFFFLAPREENLKTIKKHKFIFQCPIIIVPHLYIYIYMQFVRVYIEIDLYLFIWIKQFHSNKCEWNGKMNCVCKRILNLTTWLNLRLILFVFVWQQPNIKWPKKNKPICIWKILMEN